MGEIKLCKPESVADCSFMVSEVEIKERNKSKEERWRSFTLFCRKLWCGVKAIVSRVRYLLSRSELAGHSSSEAHIHSFTCKYLLVAYTVISILRLKYCSFSLSLKSVWLFATILQAKILDWVAIPFSRESSQPMHRTQLSRITGGFFTKIL